MAVTRKGASLTMTADADAVAAGEVFLVNGISFQGSSLTAGERLLLTDAGGSVLCDYVVEGTRENADLWGGRGPQWADGLTLAGPSGSWVLTVSLE